MRVHRYVRLGVSLDCINLDTAIDPAYGGQGIARRLIEVLIAAARSDGAKIVPVCSYAEKMMRDREEYTNVLAD